MSRSSRLGLPPRVSVFTSLNRSASNESHSPDREQDEPLIGKLSDSDTSDHEDGDGDDDQGLLMQVIQEPCGHDKTSSNESRSPDRRQDEPLSDQPSNRETPQHEGDADLDGAMQVDKETPDGDDSPSDESRSTDRHRGQPTGIQEDDLQNNMEVDEESVNLSPSQAQPTPGAARLAHTTGKRRRNERNDQTHTPKYSGNLTMRVFQEKVFEVVDLQPLQVNLLFVFLIYKKRFLQERQSGMQPG